MKYALFWCMTYLVLAYVVYHLVGVVSVSYTHLRAHETLS
jgi:hypothetical protein